MCVFSQVLVQFTGIVLVQGESVVIGSTREENDAEVANEEQGQKGADGTQSKKAEETPDDENGELHKHQAPSSPIKPYK